MESLIEQGRRFHEERERLMELMVKEMSVQLKTQREIINRDTRVKWMCDRYIECTKQLRALYEDREGQMKMEVESMTGPAEFGEFYSRLKVVKEFYKRAPNEVAVPLSVEYAEFEQLRTAKTEEAQNLVAFSDEEAYGRYLDLHDAYNRYINLRLNATGAQRESTKVDYLTFVRTFDRLYEIEKARKLQHATAYIEYLKSLVDYLYEYANKVKPLLDYDEELERIETDFNKQWDANTFPGWSKEATSALAHGGAVLDLSGFRSASELESVGMDRLKSALQALGLKCGGTLQERATRLFATKNKRPDQIDSSLFAKTGKKSADNERDRAKDIGWLEAQAYWLAEVLGEQRLNTAENVERRQALSFAERQAELEDEHGEGDDGDAGGARGNDAADDNEGVLYNPKDVPLGWDGKPIPYWLYKLHGLNLYYECEICGQVKYRGPKAFARHFQEWRHSHGMRALGIPNTTHFQNITKIDDAVALWKSIQDKKDKERWRPDHDEEYEDSMGNVLNKKMYEDLKKQGVL